MNQCQCLTQKGEQCKLAAKPGQRFCWRHIDCTKEVGGRPSSSSSSTTVIQVPVLPPPALAGPSRSRLPILAPRSSAATSSKASSASSATSATSPSSSATASSSATGKIDLGLVSMPIPLIERVTEDITDLVQAGATASSATIKTLDDIVEELGYEDVTDLVDLTEDEIDYFISTILLHENVDKLADIVQKKIDEQNVRDPHAKLVIKTRELLQELASKFCRCIKKVLDSNPNNTESMAIAICRRGVINGRGLSFPRFSCKTYPNPNDKSRYIDTPIFLPSKDRKKLLMRHPGYQLYLSSVVNGDLTKWDKLGKLEKDQYLKAVQK